MEKNPASPHNVVIMGEQQTTAKVVFPCCEHCTLYTDVQQIFYAKNAQGMGKNYILTTIKLLLSCL